VPRRRFEGSQDISAVRLAGSACIWVTELITGWEISSIPAWHNGNVYNVTSNAFVPGYGNDAPAILTGSGADMKIHLSGGKGQPLCGFAGGVLRSPV
jgi:hypothetical protein